MKYGNPLIGVALGDQQLFSSDDSAWETPWAPSEPDPTTTLWRYMSFAKFCSLMERRALFFSLVSDMADRYEGFISPPLTCQSGDRLHHVEYMARDILHKVARTCLISCWTESNYESSLMWEAYAGTEGVAVRTTYQALQESICSVAELPITFGQVEYVDYIQQQVSRFGWAPLFHKRIEYRGEGEVRAVLPGPALDGPWIHLDSDIALDPDVKDQRGRYIPVSLDILVEEVVMHPHAATWFARLVESVVQRSTVRVRVRPSAI